MIIQSAGIVSISLWNKSTSLNWLKFHMHVSDDDSNMFCKFDEIWWTLKKMLKFHNISRACMVSIFLWNNITSLNGLKFHMHVSDDDSNEFCKFDEIWWTLKKCWNFMIFQRAGTVSIFLWNKFTSLNGLKFHMHVSDDDSICSASLMKFGELWKNVEISWYFKGPALSAFFNEISQLFWIGSNFTCMFLMMIQICSASLMKFGELWKNVEISWYYKGPALSAFFYEISQLLWKGSNFTCMFLMMIPICSASLIKFDELWKNVEISWYF